MRAKSLACLVVVLLLLGCGHREEELAAPIAGWRISTPEEQGIDSRPLLAMLREIQEQELRIDSVIVVRNGHLVMEAYLPPYEREHRHIIFSATKGISALLVGLAIEEGLILDEKAKVLDLLPLEGEEIKNLDDWKRQLALEDLLTMTDGFEWQDWPYGIRAEGDFSRLLASSDGVRYILDKPIVQEPGTHFNYNSGASHLLTAIVQEVTGKTALEYANERLFHPLGIDDVGWSAYQGINNGGSELFLRPREMAKVGYLMLNEGRWEERRSSPPSGSRRRSSSTSRQMWSSSRRSMDISGTRSISRGTRCTVPRAWEGTSRSWCRIWIWWSSSRAVSWGETWLSPTVSSRKR